MSPGLADGLGRTLQLWRLRVARVAALGPTSVLTAFAAVAVLLRHRLAAGRGGASRLAARPAEARGARRAERDAAVRPAA